MNPNDDVFTHLQAAKKDLDRVVTSDARQTTRQQARAAFLASAAVPPETVVTMNGNARHSYHNSALLEVSDVSQGDRTMLDRKMRRIRLIAAVLLGVLLAGGFWSVPPLRTLAQEVIEFFIPSAENTRSAEIFIGGSPHGESQAPPPRGSLSTVIAAAPFEVHVPTTLPEGYQLADVQYTHGVVFMTLTCSEPWAITISQRAFDSASDIVGQDVGSTAVIESVDIHDANGQYVQGTWEYQMPENFEALRQSPQAQGVEVQAVWNNDLPWGRLVWAADGILFDVITAGGIMSEDTAQHSACAPTRQSFLEIALGLVPNSALNP